MRYKLILGLLLLSACLVLRAGPAKAAECADCHAVTEDKFRKNVHGAQGISCVSCHGQAAGHREDPDVKDYLNCKDKANFETINAACMKCHAKNRKMTYWEGSEHQSSDVSCTSCHKVHTVGTKSVSSESCMSCHADVRRDANKFSHHPIKEGRMQCSACHNVHGSSAPNLLSKSTTNELCISCHTEKRGPFRFAHAPVEENCLTCHKPHGSTSPRLMAQNLRSTCTNCHVFARKNTLRPDEIGSRQPPMGVRGSGLNCHGDIHGSNTDYHFR